MVLEASVKYEIVGQGAENEIERSRTELSDEENRCNLTIDVVTRPLRRRHRVNGREVEMIRI